MADRQAERLGGHEGRREQQTATRREKPRRATVADLLAVIGIATDTDLTAAVDNELAPRDTALHDGAEVRLLSPMEGG